MARKSTPSAAAKISAAKTSTAAVVTTPVRNSVVPPKSAAATTAKKTLPSHDTIAVCAYYIWKNSGGCQDENWLRAERELSAI